jgi:hypothetical protein
VPNSVIGTAHSAASFALFAMRERLGSLPSLPNGLVMSDDAPRRGTFAAAPFPTVEICNAYRVLFLSRSADSPHG